MLCSCLVSSVLTLVGFFFLFDQNSSIDTPQVNKYKEFFLILFQCDFSIFIFTCSGTYIRRVHSQGLEALVTGAPLKFIILLGQYFFLLASICISIIFLSSYFGLDYALLDFLNCIMALVMLGVIWPQFVKYLAERVQKVKENEIKKLDEGSTKPGKLFFH